MFFLFEVDNRNVAKGCRVCKVLFDETFYINQGVTDENCNLGKFFTKKTNKKKREIIIKIGIPRFFKAVTLSAWNTKIYSE